MKEEPKSFVGHSPLAIFHYHHLSQTNAFALVESTAFTKDYSNWLRMSAEFIVPATENPWQGEPPETMSTPFPLKEYG